MKKRISGTSIGIIGHIEHGQTLLATEQIVNFMKHKGGKVVIVDDSEEIKENSMSATLSNNVEKVYPITNDYDKLETNSFHEPKTGQQNRRERRKNKRK